MADDRLSGVGRRLHRCRVRLRCARLQLSSPDPDSLPQVARLERCRRAAVRTPQAVALVFVDEMGYDRWPAAAPDGMLAAPDAPTLAWRAGPTTRQQRRIGAPGALTGRVDYRDNYLVGREQVSACYRQLDHVYARAERVYVVQDNWSLHHHDDVQAALADLPRLELVWLPTSSPWLTPIEKLWRWRRQDVLKLHRLADDWHTLRERVNAFLDPFAAGSHALLRYTGLIGDGHLAYVLRSA